MPIRTARTFVCDYCANASVSTYGRDLRTSDQFADPPSITYPPLWTAKNRVDGSVKLCCNGPLCPGMAEPENP